MGARYTLSTPRSVEESEKHDFEMVESMKSVDPTSLTVSAARRVPHISKSRLGQAGLAVFPHHVFHNSGGGLIRERRVTVMDQGCSSLTLNAHGR